MHRVVMRALLVVGATQACTTEAPPAMERVQAVEAQAPVAAPSSVPVVTKTHVEPQPSAPQKLCDREFTAKDAPKIALPSSKWKTGSGPLWVNLWAAWCKPCVAEIPELMEWSREGHFAMVLVSLDDDEREWRQGASKLGVDDVKKRPPLVTSTWLEPGKGRTAFLKPLGFLETPNLPGQALVDRDGKLRCFRSGAVDANEKEAFLALLKSL
jgi:thiol-disulfide isomerase/thioredoxin